MTPETASAADLPAGNGATEGGPLPPDAPASDPGGVGSDLDRADVALVAFDDALAEPCGCDAHNEIRRQMQDPGFAAAWLRTQQAVARTLDVAERTVEKAREAS